MHKLLEFCRNNELNMSMDFDYNCNDIKFTFSKYDKNVEIHRRNSVFLSYEQVQDVKTNFEDVMINWLSKKFRIKEV